LLLIGFREDKSSRWSAPSAFHLSFLLPLRSAGIFAVELPRDGVVNDSNLFNTSAMSVESFFSHFGNEFEWGFVGSTRFGSSGSGLMLIAFNYEILIVDKEF
jgi:hypothetical protein